MFWPQQKQRERAAEGADSGKVSNLQYLHRLVWKLGEIKRQSFLLNYLCCDAWQSCGDIHILCAATWHISSCGLWWGGMRAWLMRCKLNWRSHRLMRTREDHDRRTSFDSMTSSCRFRDHIFFMHVNIRGVTVLMARYILQFLGSLFLYSSVYFVVLWSLFWYSLVFRGYDLNTIC